MLRFARRQFLHLIAGAGSLTAVSAVMAGAYPSRPVRMIVGLPPAETEKWGKLVKLGKITAQ